jgi:ABC-type Fe3+/spermidine/putrescine transport system ATPase subunit
MEIQLKEIRNFVCRGTNLEVHSGELLVLLGSNGAGKTTLLNVIAGLIAYQGSVLFEGTPVDAVPARDRKVGYVFQDLVLFPHLDVGANIGYGLQATGWPRDKQEERIDELLELLMISDLRSRYPAKLSGGEQQRVALARALASRPKILLLDEPFNSLDPQTSRFLGIELKRLHRSLGTTTIFVTHDLVEAEDVADRVAIMQDGLIEQIGCPDDILFSPRGEQISEFNGAPNILECQSARSIGHGLMEASCNELRIIVPHNGETLRKISILPRDVLISPYPPANGVNVFTGTVREITAPPGAVRAIVETGGCRLVAELPRQFSEAHIHRDSEVSVELALTKIRTRE